MITPSVEKKLPYDVDTVWALVGPFGALADWHPHVPACELSEDGLVRTIPVPPTPAVERMFPEESGAHHYAYTVDAGPMPLKNYHAVMGVREDGEGSVLYYRAKGEADGIKPEVLRAMLEGFFRAGFDAVEQKLENV